MRGIRQIYRYLRIWPHRVRFGNDFVCGQKVILRTVDFLENPRACASNFSRGYSPHVFRDSLEIFAMVNAIKNVASLTRNIARMR